MGSHAITHLIHAYGLIVVFLAAGLQALALPIPGGTALVVAGIDASTKHGLPVIGVIVAGAAGALAGTSAGFALGRWRGQVILHSVGRRLRQRPERIEELRRQFQAHALAPLFMARFITGARNLAGLLAGSSGMMLGPFLLISAAAAVAWSTLITLEYYFAGHAILGAPTWLQVALIILGVIATIVSVRVWHIRARDRAQPAPRPADATD